MPIPTKLSQFNRSSAKSQTFIIEGKGHTLGNALRLIIIAYRDVKYCGYSINDPSEVEILIHIEMFEGAAIDALEKGLRDLMDSGDPTLYTSEKGIVEYKN